MRLLGSHGSERRYEHETLGFNSRLDAIQAIVLAAKLRRLDDWNARRRAAAAVYATLLADVEEVVLPDPGAGLDHVWHLFVVRVDERDAFAEGLADAGIQTGIHYPVPLTRSPALAGHRVRTTDCPVAERAAGRILSLPMFPHLSAAQLVEVADAVRAVAMDRRLAWSVG